jgi:hypothetical protein
MKIVKIVKITVSEGGPKAIAKPGVTLPCPPHAYLWPDNDDSLCIDCGQPKLPHGIATHGPENTQ